MPTAKFLKDRKRGNKGVQLVKERIEKHGGTVDVVPDGHFQDYDIRVSQKGLDYIAEVKTDFRFKDTGNIAIERQAMEHSKTDIWFYVLQSENPEVHLIDLKKAQAIAPHYRSGSFGERQELVYLVPYSVFKSQISLGQI